jgi:hypothetical protein
MMVLSDFIIDFSNFMDEWGKKKIKRLEDDYFYSLKPVMRFKGDSYFVQNHEFLDNDEIKLYCTDEEGNTVVFIERENGETERVK